MPENRIPRRKSLRFIYDLVRLRHQREIEREKEGRKYLCKMVDAVFFKWNTLLIVGDKTNDSIENKMNEWVE